MTSKTKYLTFNTRNKRESIHITGGALDLGPWQAIYYAEFDGRRKKRLVSKAIGE